MAPSSSINPPPPFSFSSDATRSRRDDTRRPSRESRRTYTSSSAARSRASARAKGAMLSLLRPCTPPCTPPSTPPSALEIEWRHHELVRLSSSAALRRNACAWARCWEVT